MGEKALNIKGQFKAYTLYFIILAAIISIILKTILSGGITLTYIITEIVSIVLLLFIKFNEPKEFNLKEKDNNLNKYYNNAFKMFTKVIILIYFLSLILLHKNLRDIYFIPGLFINTYFTITLISSIYLVKKHQVYTNGCVISSNKKNYYKYVFTNILKGLLFAIAIAIGAVLINILISNSVATLFVLVTLLVVVLIAIIYYLLYSIYEYNKYHEIVMLEKKHHPIFSKNIILYFSIVSFAIILKDVLNILILNNIQTPSTISDFTIFFDNIVFVFVVISYLFLYFIIFSLKESLMRLKEKNINLINIIFYISIILTSVSLTLYLLTPLLNEMINSGVLSGKLMVWVNYIVFSSTIIILGLFTFYGYKQKFPKKHFLLVPTVLLLGIIIMALIDLSLNNLLRHLSVVLGIKVVILTSLLYISYVYSKPFEMIVEVY